MSEGSLVFWRVRDAAVVEGGQLSRRAVLTSGAKCGFAPRGGRGRSRAYLFVGFLSCFWAAARGYAQELEPRAYSPSPVGVNLLVLSATRSTGDVLFDPSLPVTDVNAHFNAAVAAYVHTFGLLEHAASVGIAVPYAWGTVTGNVGNNQQEAHRSGIADAQLRLAVNLIGGPALSPREFAARIPRTTLGLSLTVAAPSGQYDGTKLINIGTNRWAFKPELGVSYPTGRWFIEGYAGVWFFTDNTDYYGGTHRQQNPVGALQGHLSYTFKPRLWLAFDATYYAGGQTRVDGVPNENRQSNSRIGLTLSVPAGARQSVKFSWSQGAAVRVGGDFTTYAVAWQYNWFD